MDYLIEENFEVAKRIKKEYNVSLPETTITAVVHFLGPGDASLYFKTLNEAGSLDKAQQAVNGSILKRDPTPPSNPTILEYLEKYYNSINQ